MFGSIEHFKDVLFDPFGIYKQIIHAPTQLNRDLFAAGLGIPGESMPAFAGFKAMPNGIKYLLQAVNCFWAALARIGLHESLPGLRGGSLMLSAVGA